MAPDVVCSREQSVVAGCRRLVGFLSEWLKRRTSGASPLFEFQNFADVLNCYGRYCLWIWSCGRNVVDFQCVQFFTKSRRLKSVALAWYVAPFRFARQLGGTMIEKIDPLSEVGVCVLAVRGCASARGRLSTVLVGGRLSRNNAQLGMFMPTSFRMICSVSEFLVLCVVRSVGSCCC